MNDLYKNECADMRNFFYPAMKLIEKQRIGSKIKKIHDKAKTPYERLMASSDITKEQKKPLTEKFQQLNPFTLRDNLEKKLQLIFNKIDLGAVDISL